MSLNGTSEIACIIEFDTHHDRNMILIVYNREHQYDYHLTMKIKGTNKLLLQLISNSLDGTEKPVIPIEL